jgi:dolichol kinase
MFLLRKYNLSGALAFFLVAVATFACIVITTFAEVFITAASTLTACALLFAASIVAASSR